MKIDWDSFDLTLVLDGKPIDLKEKYQKDIRISKETIDEDLMKQASLYAFYAVMAELAEEAYEQAKLELELLEATVDEHIRVGLIQKGEKVTDKKLEKLVAINEDRIESVKNKIQARKNRGILKALARAFEQRNLDVIALGHICRQERDVDIFIKKEKLKKEYEK